MPSAVDDRIHWSCWAEWANYMVKDTSFRLRTLQAEQFLEGERGRLGLAAMTAIADAIERVHAVAAIMAGAALDFDQIATLPAHPADEEGRASNG